MDPLTIPASCVLTARYERLRSAVAGVWDGSSSLHGLGILMRSGMAAWIYNQLDSTVRKPADPGSRLEHNGIPGGLSRQVVDILAGMALAAATTMEVHQ